MNKARMTPSGARKALTRDFFMEGVRKELRAQEQAARSVSRKKPNLGLAAKLPTSPRDRDNLFLKRNGRSPLKDIQVSPQ